MARNMRNSAIYDAVPASGVTPPPHLALSGHYLCGFGYRVVRPQGAGSWLLFYTARGRGLFRQPGLELESRPGDLCLLAPDAYSDYGVPPPPGDPSFRPLVSAAYAERYAKRHPVLSRRRRREPFGRYVRFLHLEPRGGIPHLARAWRFHWVHFQPRAHALEWLRLPEVGRGLYRLAVGRREVRGRMEGAFERMHRDLLAGGSLGEVLAAGALEEILVLGAGEQGRGLSPLDPRVVRALRIVQDAPAGAHSVAALARAAALSPSRFAHLFKVQTGASVRQAALGIRIRQACSMLACTEERISDIAFALGFCTPFHFSRLFSDRLGCSPRAYREALRSGQGSACVAKLCGPKT